MICRRLIVFFFFSSRRRHTRFDCDWSSDVCSSDLPLDEPPVRIVELEGSAPASRLEDALGVTLATRGVQTVAGLLVQALGRIPRPGERFALHGVEFDILAATAPPVERVALRPRPVRPLPLRRAGE